MKKLFCIVLSAFLLLSLCACGGNEGSTGPTTEPWDGKHRATIAGEEVVFEAWEEAGVPTSGSYYLTQDVELEAAVTVEGDLKLHLNGHTVIAKSNVVIGNLFVIPAGSSMTVYDNALSEDFTLEYDPEAPDEVVEIPTGTISSNRSFSGNMTVSSMFRVEGKLTVAGGHIDASLMNLEDRANGMVAYVASGGELTICGGVITGGTTWSFEVPEDGSEAPYGFGGAVYIEKGASCAVSGGTVWKGSAAAGGNFYVAGDDTGSGTLTVTGGSIIGGEATKRGGNVCVDGSLEMSDGQIQWGTSYGHGGNIFLSGKLNMTGGTLLGGACDVNSVQNQRGGNLAVNGLHATVHITNTQILDGTASCKETHGGNIACFGYGAETFEVGEGTVITGGKGHRGGNLYIGHFNKDVPEENMDYIFTGVTLGGGTTTYRGANMCTDTKDTTRRILVTFNNCTTSVDDATELNLAIGAGAYDVSQCDIVINGGTWNDGGIHIYGSSTVTANGVTFTKCEASGTGTYTENP